MKLTKAYKIANYDKLAKSAEVDWLAVDILATGEEYDLRYVEKVTVGEWLTGKVYRAAGSAGGILILIHRIEGQRAQARALYLEDYLREFNGDDVLNSEAWRAHRNLADNLRVLRNKFFEDIRSKHFVKETAERLTKR